jgi:hypothetical protein
VACDRENNLRFILGTALAGNPIEAAHVRYSDAKVGRRNPGMARKPSDAWAVSLCRFHHQHDQHAGEERAFWERLSIDPGELCPELYRTFKADGSGEAVIRKYAQGKST